MQSPSIKIKYSPLAIIAALFLIIALFLPFGIWKRQPLCFATSQNRSLFKNQSKGHN
jgi:hypothetical protein